MNTPHIVIALQKSGRLAEDSLELIKSAGIKVRSDNGRLMISSENFPLSVLFLRDDDIPGYVADGVADIGIVGENVMLEKESDVEVLERLGFSRCRLSLALPKSEHYAGVQSLHGKTIATTYVRSLKRYLDANGVKAKVREIRGSTEIAPGIGLSDAICDLVSTGSTLVTHGLKEVETIFQSEAVLISGRTINPEKQRIVADLRFRLRSVLKARGSKYILLNVPNDCVDKVTPLLPGLRSPTVFPLAESGWSSIHAVINENDFWEKIEQLKQAGAEGILVIPIEKMIA